jgi:hypothetical protein
MNFPQLVQNDAPEMNAIGGRGRTPWVAVPSRLSEIGAGEVQVVARIRSCVTRTTCEKGAIRLESKYRSEKLSKTNINAAIPRAAMHHQPKAQLFRRTV